MWLTSRHHAGLEYGHWKHDTIPAVSYMYMYALAASDKFQPLLCGCGFEKSQLVMHWWLLPLLYMVLLGYVPHDDAEIHPLPVAMPFLPHETIEVAGDLVCMAVLHSLQICIDPVPVWLGILHLHTSNRQKINVTEWFTVPWAAAGSILAGRLYARHLRTRTDGICQGLYARHLSE